MVENAKDKMQKNIKICYKIPAKVIRFWEGNKSGKS